MIFSLIIGLILGLSGGAITAKTGRFNFAHQSISRELIISGISWSTVALYGFLFGDAYGFIGIALGAFLISFFFTENAVYFFKKYILLLTSSILVAHFLYNGSARAMHFPLFLSASVFLAHAISSFIITRKKIVSNILTIRGGVYALVAYPVTIIFASDFFPHIHEIGIVLGIVVSLALIRITTLWKHIAAITLIVLVGYTLGDFYNIAIIGVAMLAFASTIPLEQKNERVLNGLAYIMLLYVFMRSVSLAGKSLLYDLSDPFVIAGLLVGVTIPYLLPLIEKKKIIYAIACVLPIISLIILGKIFGTIMIAGCITGLILITITQGGLLQTAHKETDLEGFILVFLYTIIIGAPLIH